MQLGVILTALAVLVGAVASGASTTIGWVRVMYALAALLSLLALFYQWRASKPFVLNFDHSTWVPDNAGSKSIIILARQHRKGRNATGRLEEMDPNGDWQTVMGDATTRNNGDVVASVNVNAQLAGRIVVY